MVVRGHQNLPAASEHGITQRAANDQGTAAARRDEPGDVEQRVDNRLRHAEPKHLATWSMAGCPVTCIEEDRAEAPR